MTKNKFNYKFKKILKNTRSFEIENKIIPIKKIINLTEND
tara:strand:+ start:269 stop:388 length:120 start_codon:yes stop_codon:yes gene_type:complete